MDSLAPEQPYYLNNFLSLLNHVTGLYSDLLDQSELALTEDFHSLSPQAARLWVRCLMRRGPALRVDRLNYEEIPNRDQALSELLERGFILFCPHTDPEQLIGTLLKQEIQQLFDGDLAEQGLSSRASKAAMTQSLLQLLREGGPETDEGFYGALSGHAPWITLLRQRELLLYRLCFFGNLWQDLSEFVISDLGILRFENVDFSALDRYFSSRADLVASFELLNLGEELGAGLSSADLETMEEWLRRAAMDISPASDPGVIRRYERVANCIAREMERRGEDPFLDRALELYEQITLPPARERRARIHLARARKGNADSEVQAHNLLSEMILSPRDQNELELASRRLGREFKPEILVREETVAPIPDLRVEELTAEHLRRSNPGALIWHSENSLFCSLLGLAFWDIVFMALPGAFCNPFQRGPVDLFRPDFMERRRERIERRLHQISRDMSNQAFASYLLDRYREKEGTANFLVDWRRVDARLVEFASMTMGGSCLAEIFSVMLFDLGSNCSGFPDLFLIWSDGSYELIEVKGPGDRLQSNQRRWFARFAQWKIPCSMMNVKIGVIDAIR